MAKKTTSTAKKAAPEPAPQTWLQWIPPALAFILFSMGLRNEMLGIDDHTATLYNPAVTEFEPFTRFNLGMYAPLTWLGHAIAYAVGKENPLPYHLLSLLVHVFNVWLAGRLALRLTQSQQTAFWITLLFAIHPVQVESVAWIAGFSTPLYALFYLLGCLAYLKHTEGGPDQRQQYGLALGAFVLACLSKSAAVTLPLVLPLLDWWAGRSPFDRRRMLGYAPFFALALVFGVLTIHARNISGMDIAGENGHSLLDRFLMVCYAPVLYWYKILLPFKLNIYYSFDKINGRFPWPYWVAPVVLAGAFFAAWRYRRSARYVWFGLLFYMANLSVMLPFRSLGTFELCADHYNYVAIIGIAMMLVLGVKALAERYPGAAGLFRGVSGLWIAMLIVLCVMQIRTWKTSISVVTHAIDNGSHHDGLLYEGRANAYAQKKELKKALQDYTKAIEINPERWDSYKYRGSLFGVLKQYDRSAADLSKYLEKYPDDPEQLYNLGLTLFNLNHQAEGIKALDRCLEINPDFARAYRARGNAYLSMGDSARAQIDLQEFERRQGQGEGQ